MVTIIKKGLLFSDKILVVLFFVLLGVFRPDWILFAAFLVTILYIVITKRAILFQHLALATLLSVIWMVLARGEYGYNQDFINIFGINTFPLFAWALGLFAMYLLYSHWERIIKKQNYLRQLILFSVFYWVLLLVAEKVGHDIFNIQNIATANYSALPICDCLHAPPWMQTTYLLMGPLYFSLSFLLKLENPHIRR